MEYKFTGVFIPAHIFKLKTINWSEKILWCEIQALQGDDCCYASNDYFAKQFDTTPEKISAKISKLKKLGLIEQISFDGRIRKIRAIFEPKTNINEKDNAELPKIDNSGLPKTARQGYPKRQVEIKDEIKEKKEKEKKEFTDKDVADIIDGFRKNFMAVDAVVGTFCDGNKKNEGIKIKNPNLLAFIKQRFPEKTRRRASDWAIDHCQGKVFNANALLKMFVKFQIDCEPNINYNIVCNEYIAFCNKKVVDE